MTSLWKVIHGVPLALEAIITDFDGVVVDSEPLHLEGFAKVLAELGIELTEEAYYERYLGFDDHDCFVAALQDFNREAPEPLVAELEAKKSAILQEIIPQRIAPLPGSVELFSAAKNAGLPLAICSGALRAEIELCAKTIGLWDTFPIVVAAKDVTAGKPDPEGYIKARKQLSDHIGRELSPAHCVVFEDSPAGIDAAKSAGLHVIGLTTSYPPAALGAADRLIGNLSEIDLNQLEDILT